MPEDQAVRVPAQSSEIDKTWLMSDSEFAALGDGEVAYIKSLTSQQARDAYPSVDDLPDDLDLFALHAADGTPLALTDDYGTAIEHAMGDELEIAALH